MYNPWEIWIKSMITEHNKLFRHPKESKIIVVWIRILEVIDSVI